MIKNILITGSKGYIGSRLIEIISKYKDLNIIGTDISYFSGCNFYSEDKYTFIRQDLRKFDYSILRNIDCVIHLGALSNDPLGSLDHNLTYDINTESTIKLAKKAMEMGVKKFIFSSSCIMYGQSNEKYVNEKSKLDPKTAYAKSKVLAEKEILKLSSNDFCVTSLRNGTVYGFSNYMRFDTVLNNFIGNIYFNNSILINGNGKTIRPVVYIDDVCQSFIKILRCNSKLIQGEAFNNGSNLCNITIAELANKVSKNYNTKVYLLNNKNIDERSYRADFSKIKKAIIPPFNNSFNKNANNVILKLNKLNAPRDVVFINKFIRMKTFKNLISQKILNKKLQFN